VKAGKKRTKTSSFPGFCAILPTLPTASMQPSPGPPLMWAVRGPPPPILGLLLSEFPPNIRFSSLPSKSNGCLLRLLCTWHPHGLMCPHCQSKLCQSAAQASPPSRRPFQHASLCRARDARCRESSLKPTQKRAMLCLPALKHRLEGLARQPVRSG